MPSLLKISSHTLLVVLNGEVLCFEPNSALKVLSGVGVDKLPRRTHWDSKRGQWYKSCTVFQCH